ncbi:MAG TPA: hypothetical protein VII75_11515 [Thermoanaerobaculia bacterium]|nr:hypothetical protein [Thermoanaerobaculia bacterium]
MLKHTFAVGLVVVLAGCASSTSESGMGNAKVRLIEPEIAFTQTNYLPPVAKEITGAVPVHYQVRVANKSGEPITLTRIDVQSIGLGAYTLHSQSRPFKTKIAPDHFEIVELWLPAIIDDVTVYGANGPVTLRAVAHFDSPVGQFDSVTVQQVHEHPGDENRAR